MKKDKILLFIIIFVTLIMGVGYATVNNISLSISGNSVSANNGNFSIISVTQTDLKNLTASETHTDTSVELALSFSVNKNDTSATDEHSVTYQVVVYNDSIKPVAVGSEVFSPNITTAASNGQSLEYIYEPIGITLGEEIKAKQTKQFSIKVTLVPSGGVANYSAGVNTSVEVQEVNLGIFTATLTGSTSGDLTGSNTVTPFTVTLLNSLDTSKTYNFSLSNPNFQICDANGNALANQTIAAETENQTFTFYIKNSSGMNFPSSPININVFLVPTDSDAFSIGVVTIAVNVDQTMTDNQDPVISSLNVTKGNTTRTLAVTWEASDNIGIDHYDVYLYKSNGQVAASSTGLTTSSYTFNNVDDGTYYITLIAYDSRNSATMSTESEARTWTYNVTINCSNCSANPNGGTVEAGGTYRTTFSGTGDYSAPSSITSVYMYNSTTNQRQSVSNRTYHYNDSTTSSNQFVLSGVTGDLEINASGRSNGGICLIEGTRIKLANGQYKKIEDIRYTDLLSVWSYDSGSLTYEYPIWIEKSNESYSYQETTFSDGTVLKTVGLHQVFSLDDNKFINIMDENGFIRVGTRIAKEVNGKIIPIKVTKVETIYEKVKYYYVASTIYYNVISEDIITTSDQIVPGVTLSNMYGFEENIKWPSIRKDIISKPGALYEYKDLDIMPYYLYYGSRGNETKLFVNMGYATTPQLIEYLLKTQLNKEKAVKPITDKNGNRLWMVTTSLDKVTDYNISKYLQKEGLPFKLPNSAKVKKWYSTSENKYYKPGEYVVVNHGMHFEAIY